MYLPLCIRDIRTQLIEQARWVDAAAQAARRAPTTERLQLLLERKQKVGDRVLYLEGIWDYYEEYDPDASRAALFGYRKSVEMAIESLPYAARAIKEVIALPGCIVQMAIYTGAELGLSVIPAVSIW